MAGFEETWAQIPFITRYCGALAVALYVIYCINPYWAVNGWNYPGVPAWQVWRYPLAVFSYSGSKFQGILELLGLCMTLQTIELGFWKQRSSGAYYILFVGLIFNLVGPKLGVYAFLSCLNMALTWTVAQESPFTQSTFIIVTLEQRYVPLAQLGLRLLLGGIAGAIEPLLGIVAAHLFMFLTELLPRAGGPKWFVKPPKPLLYLDQMEENSRKNKQYGAARRLGR